MAAKIRRCVGCGCARIYLVSGATLQQQTPDQITDAKFKGPMCLPCVAKVGLGVDLMQPTQQQLEYLYAVVPGVK